MKKFYEKDKIWFAVFWIIVYVFLFSSADSLSEMLGMPKSLTCAAGLVLSGVLFGFIRKNGLSRHFGLCPAENGGGFFFWLPLVLISGVNLYGGVKMNSSLPEAVLYVISMCFVAFLEEVIFRGLLFKGMSEGSLTAAVAVSSLTFGMGHIINLLLGEPLADTLLQLLYASAVGFCYTAVFLRTGSILPCILSHAVVNGTSAFAVESGPAGKVVTALAQTAVALCYGIWLLKNRKRAEREKDGVG